MCSSLSPMTPHARPTRCDTHWVGQISSVESRDTQEAQGRHFRPCNHGRSHRTVSGHYVVMSNVICVGSSFRFHNSSRSCRVHLMIIGKKIYPMAMRKTQLFRRVSCSSVRVSCSGVRTIDRGCAFLSPVLSCCVGVWPLCTSSLHQHDQTKPTTRETKHTHTQRTQKRIHTHSSLSHSPLLSLSFPHFVSFHFSKPTNQTDRRVERNPKLNSVTTQ